MSETILSHMLPVLAGLAFATIGVCYQAAERRGVAPVRLLLFMAIFGAALFAYRSSSAGDWSLPGTLVAWAAVAGLGQYGCMKLVGVGMKLGPFSGLWCMLSMNFAPVIVYAAIAQQTVPTPAQGIAVAAALACCVIASTTVKQPEDRAAGRPRYLAYGLLLLSVLILNAILNMGLQRLAGDTANTSRFLFVAYLAIAAGCLFDMIAAIPGRAELARALLPGLAAAAGSICGMLAISAAAARSGPRAFLVSSIVMLLIPMLVSVIVFRERPTGRWIATLALGLIAVALSNF